MQYHPILDHWARAVPPGLPEPRIINGGLYAGHGCHEFTSPYWSPACSPTIPLTEWWNEERDIKNTFQAVYPVSPPHPLFLRDTRRLIGHLACAHTIYLVRVVYHREAERVAAAGLAVEEVFIRDAMRPLLATEYLSAWLNLPAWQVFRLGAGWSAKFPEEAMLYHNDELAVTDQVWSGHTSYDDTGAWDTTPLPDDSGGWGGTGLSMGWASWGTDNSWPAGGGWDQPGPRRGRQYPKNLGRPFHPPRRGNHRRLVSPLKHYSF
ncbi:hypothetical protein C8F04DRAFT_1269181 [Mycena alexandri]|uniref:Uncharacterized protein n=1 Tax=Mycena alexandri TaxID=1745969 RepID=A0AAD6SCP8_9AGAR|nr:hypothetical protein C8F04DRAFT_1269181 [Mycena alexandri]